jgi:hypothetical protein
MPLDDARSLLLRGLFDYNDPFSTNFTDGTDERIQRSEASDLPWSKHERHGISALIFDGLFYEREFLLKDQSGALSPEHPELFFVSARPDLGAGLVKPGHWGQGYNKYEATRTTYGDPWQLIVELAVENERLQAYAHLPSRLEGSFAFLSLETAIDVAPQLGGEALVLWSCELEEPGSPTHIGDFGVLHNIRRGASYLRAKELATRYWSETHSADRQELLSLSPLRLKLKLAMFDRQGGWSSLATNDQHRAAVQNCLSRRNGEATKA